MGELYECERCKARAGREGFAPVAEGEAPMCPCGRKTRRIGAERREMATSEVPFYPDIMEQSFTFDTVGPFILTRAKIGGRRVSDVHLAKRSGCDLTPYRKAARADRPWWWRPAVQPRCAREPKSPNAAVMSIVNTPRVRLLYIRTVDEFQVIVRAKPYRMGEDRPSMCAPYREAAAVPVTHPDTYVSPTTLARLGGNRNIGVDLAWDDPDEVGT